MLRSLKVQLTYGVTDMVHVTHKANTHARVMLTIRSGIGSAACNVLIGIIPGFKSQRQRAGFEHNVHQTNLSVGVLTVLQEEGLGWIQTARSASNAD